MGAALMVGLLERFILLVVPAPIQPAIVTEDVARRGSVASPDTLGTQGGDGGGGIRTDEQGNIINSSNDTLDSRPPSPATDNVHVESFLDMQYPGECVTRVRVGNVRVM